MAIEGSALLPELVANLRFDNISSIWLTASNEFLRQRIYQSSQYSTKSPFEQMLIDKFCQRNCLLNDRIINDVDRLGLVSFDVEQVSTPDELIDKYLSIAPQCTAIISSTPTLSIYIDDIMHAESKQPTKVNKPDIF